MLVLTVLVMGAGFLIGGDQGLKIAFVIALAMNFFLLV